MIMVTTENFARNIVKRKALREHVSLFIIEVTRFISVITN